MEFQKCAAIDVAIKIICMRGILRCQTWMQMDNTYDINVWGECQKGYFLHSL